MFHNVVVGKPIIDPWRLISSTKEEFENFDSKDTLFTNELKNVNKKFFKKGLTI